MYISLEGCSKFGERNERRWKKVEDDGHTLLRGQRTAVCRKTYCLLTSEPCADQIVTVPPLKEAKSGPAKPFACGQTVLRSPAETKGKGYRKTENTAAAWRWILAAAEEGRADPGIPVPGRKIKWRRAARGGRLPQPFW